MDCFMGRDLFSPFELYFEVGVILGVVLDCVCGGWWYPWMVLLKGPRVSISSSGCF